MTVPWQLSLGATTVRPRSSGWTVAGRLRLRPPRRLVSPVRALRVGASRLSIPRQSDSENKESRAAAGPAHSFFASAVLEKAPPHWAPFQ